MCSFVAVVVWRSGGCGSGRAAKSSGTPHDCLFLSSLTGCVCFADLRTCLWCTNPLEWQCVSCYQSRRCRVSSLCCCDAVVVAHGVLSHDCFALAAPSRCRRGVLCPCLALLMIRVVCTHTWSFISHFPRSGGAYDDGALHVLDRCNGTGPRCSRDDDSDLSKQQAAAVVSGVRAQTATAWAGSVVVFRCERDDRLPPGSRCAPRLSAPTLV